MIWFTTYFYKLVGRSRHYYLVLKSHLQLTLVLYLLWNPTVYQKCCICLTFTFFKSCNIILEVGNVWQFYSKKGLTTLNQILRKKYYFRTKKKLLVRFGTKVIFQLRIKIILSLVWGRTFCAWYNSQPPLGSKRHCC